MNEQNQIQKSYQEQSQKIDNLFYDWKTGAILSGLSELEKDYSWGAEYVRHAKSLFNSSDWQKISSELNRAGPLTLRDIVAGYNAIIDRELAEWVNPPNLPRNEIAYRVVFSENRPYLSIETKSGLCKVLDSLGPIGESALLRACGQPTRADIIMRKIWPSKKPNFNKEEKRLVAEALTYSLPIHKDILPTLGVRLDDIGAAIYSTWQDPLGH